MEGIVASKGKYFKVLDHDDTLSEQETLLNQQKIIEQHPELAAVSGQSNLMNANSRIYKIHGYRNAELVLDKVKVSRDLPIRI